MYLNTSKLILGTANLCSIYGNKLKYINYEDTKKILNYSLKKKINILDISSDYKFFQKYVQKNIFKNWKICFKISNKDFKKIKTENDFKKYLDNLNIFFKKKIEYFLIHDVKNLLSAKGKNFYKILLKFKKKKKLNKIGISVYSNYEIFKVLKKYKIDTIQAPYNVLNQELNNIKLIKLLKKRGVELHIRSIFLQGVLVNKKLASQKINKFKILKLWFDTIKKNKINPIYAIFNFLNKNIFYNKIVIGVESIKHFNQILNYKLPKEKIDFSLFKTRQKKLIDPRKW